MKERSEWIDKLISNYDSRVAYIKSKISINVPSQIKALRRRQSLTQELLAKEANMKQSRISAIEYPGGVSFTVETLTRLAAAFKVGLVIKFVPFSEMLRWENNYSQDLFNAARIDNDIEFTNPDIKGELSLAASMGSGALIFNFPAKDASQKEVGAQFTAINYAVSQMAGIAEASSQAHQ
jgi:transcriptional regulator with XRE-family HTH domain